MDLPHQLSSTSPQLRDLLDRRLASGREHVLTKRAARTLQRQRRLEANEIAYLVAAYHAGASIRELAETHQLHRDTVRDHLKRNGIDRRPYGVKLNPDQVHEAAKIYAEGASLAELGKRFDVDPATIRNTFRRAGLPIRARPGWSSRSV